MAVLVGLIATLLGAVEDAGPEVKVNIDTSGANASELLLWKIEHLI